MKTLVVWALLLSVAGLQAQDVTTSPAPAASLEAGVSAPPELLESAYLFEVGRHLFRWYMDESDVEKLAGVQSFPFWVRRLDVKLDEGDRSQIAEIVLPLMGISAQVKKADYTIEDLGVTIKSPAFRIVNVARIDAPVEPSPDYKVVAVNYEEMKGYLFRTRSQAEFPNEEMFERLRVALREHLGLDSNKGVAGEHVVHMAPLSPVANELWVFIESQKILVRFASDIDLENPGMWKHQSLAVRTYDILNQTVVSLHEAPGSNAFLTRDQAGRALFNCVVLGRRLVVVNPIPPVGGTGNAEAPVGKAPELSNRP